MTTTTKAFDMATSALTDKLDAALLKNAANKAGQAERSLDKFIDDCVNREVQPSFFLSPDTKDSKSTANSTEFKAMKLVGAYGIGKAEGDLLAQDGNKMQSRKAELVKMGKAERNKKTKAKILNDAEKLQDTIDERNAISRKVGSMLRDWARKLITRYAELAKVEALTSGEAENSKQANEIAKKRKAELEAASGFKSAGAANKPSKPRQTKHKPVEETSASKLSTACRDALEHLQAYDGELPLKTVEFNKAIATLKLLAELKA